MAQKLCLYFSCFGGQDVTWSVLKPLVLWQDPQGSYKGSGCTSIYSGNTVTDFRECLMELTFSE